MALVKSTAAPIPETKKNEKKEAAIVSDKNAAVTIPSQSLRSHDQRKNIENLETHLWSAADNLRANSKLTADEYCMPVLGVIFLRHATNRYNEAHQQIHAEQLAGKMPKRPLTAADFKKRRALALPKEARYDELLKLPKGTDLGTALVDAMNAVERDFEPLRGQLPKDYTKFENSLLEDLLRVFDSETLRTVSGDVFGRINEYFLMKFASMSGEVAANSVTEIRCLRASLLVLRTERLAS